MSADLVPEIPPITEQSLPPKSPLCRPVGKGAKHLSSIENVRVLKDKMVKKENAAAAHSSSQVFSSQVAWKGWWHHKIENSYPKGSAWFGAVIIVVPKPNSQRVAGVGQRRVSLLRIHSFQHLQSGAP